MKNLLLMFGAIFLGVGIIKATQKRWNAAIACVLIGAVDLGLAFSLMS